jgi:hypothetical protein
MEKNKRTSSFGEVSFVVSVILVMVIATTLEMALLKEWVIAIPRGTLQGTVAVIAGSIIVFAISWAVSCLLLKKYNRNEEPLEGENDLLPKKTGKFQLLIPVGFGIADMILLQLFLCGYIIPIPPYGTHKGGMIVGIGMLIIIATAFLLLWIVMQLVRYFSKKRKHNGHQVSI